MKFLSPTLRLYKSNSPDYVSKNFKVKEFIDGVSDYVLIDSVLIEKLQKLRDLLDCSIEITSGFRSSEKQKQLKEMGYKTAKGISTHEVGCAVDLKTGRHTGEELEEYARQAGFKSVGVASTWIHVDIRDDKERRWEY